MTTIREAAQTFVTAYDRMDMCLSDHAEALRAALAQPDPRDAEIERLRADVTHWREARETALRAGDLMKDEIERLRADVAAGVRLEVEMSRQAIEQDAEIERLRAAAQPALDLTNAFVASATITSDQVRNVRDGLRTALAQPDGPVSKTLKLKIQRDKRGVYAVRSQPALGMTFDEWFRMQPHLTNEGVCRVIWEAAQREARSPTVAAPAQPAPEPVAWGCWVGGKFAPHLIVGSERDVDMWCGSENGRREGRVKGPLFTTPPTIEQAVAAERERCKRIVQLAQRRIGHHDHDGEHLGHYDTRMIADIESGAPPRA